MQQATEVSSEEARAYIKGLIDAGVMRWLDPVRGLDEYDDDEQLPLNVAVPIYEITTEQEEELLAYFGVSPEATGRVVKLSPSSEAVCPMHERELRPDVCRSCRFLEGA